MIHQIFFEVFTPLPTLNKLLRLHWAAKAKIQKTLAAEVALIVREMESHDDEIPVGFLGQREKRVVVIMLRRKKLMDEDAKYGAVKPLLDAIKKAGLIYDDSPEWLTLRVNQEKNDKDRTLVEVRGR